MLPLAKEPGSQKSPTLCSEGCSWVQIPPLQVCYILLLVYGLSLASACQYWGVPMAVMWHGPILAGTSMSLENISQCPPSAFRAANLLFLAAPAERLLYFYLDITLS